MDNARICSMYGSCVLVWFDLHGVTALPHPPKVTATIDYQRLTKHTERPPGGRAVALLIALTLRRASVADATEPAGSAVQPTS
ncbi:hypothetical protein XHV734_1571 [Xanthomonas hortorum pv. vitians]|nr:hypothetical protein XHV734_1571 [Xanthomonas hortorum pv. vitians]